MKIHKKNYKRNRFDFYRILTYFFAFFLLLSCNSVYALASGTFVSYCCFGLLAILCFLRGKSTIKRINPKAIMLVFPIYWLLLFISAILIPSRGLSYYFRFFLFLPLMLLFVSMNSSEENLDFMLILSNLISLLALISIFLWLFGPILGVIKPIGNIRVNWGDMRIYTNYYYLLYTTRAHRRAVGNIVVWRNLAFYPEAPFSSMIFCFGLASELFLRNELKKRRVLVILIAIFSTISTSGMISAVFMCFMYRILVQYGKAHRTVMAFFVRIVFIPLMLSLGIVFISMFLLDYKQATDLGNYLSHMNAFSNGFKAFLDKPFTGYGFKYGNKMGNTTSGFFRIMIYGGLPLLSIYMWPFLKSIRYCLIEKKYMYLVFVLVVFAQLVLVVCQNSLLIFAYLSIFLVFYDSTKTMRGYLQTNSIQGDS